MKVDWQLVAKRVKPETFASIQAFRSRQAQLLKTVSELREQATPLDLTHYSQLKNQSVVAEARKSLAAFKPTAYPLKEQSEIIASSRILAVAEAQKTKESVAAELVDLKLTLVNIETARPIMELTVLYMITLG